MKANIPVSRIRKYARDNGKEIEEILDNMIREYEKETENAEEEKYHVIMVDDMMKEAEVTDFDNYDKACAYLHWLWEDKCNDMYAAYIDLNESETYHEENYAKIRSLGKREILFYVEEASKPRAAFAVVNWKRYIL